MEENYNVKYFQKPFVNCRIEWKIENFCFAYRNETSNIVSEEFDLKGIQATKWRMTLDVNWDGKEDGGCMSLYLERLSDSAADIVWANWEVTMTAGRKTYAEVENSYYFEQNAKKDVALKSATEVLANLHPFEPDTLRIECHLIIREEFETVKLVRSANLGLRCLSRDLKNMLKDKKYKDITIRVNQLDIKAHRVILSRNKILKYLMAKSKDGVVKLQNLNYEILQKFVYFMYSGDLEFILGNPSISMHKCVEFFNCDISMSYYAPKQLNMHTKFEVDEYDLHWTITDFNNRRDNCISSPLFKAINGCITWQLHFYTNTKNNEDYFSIFAEIIEGEKPQHFSLEFQIQDVSGQTFYPNRILRFNKCYDNLGLKKFFSRTSLENSNILFDDNLSIIFKVRTSKANQKSSLTSHMMSLITSTDERSYDKLSSEMADLLKEYEISDITLLCGSEEFRAHKSILSARSPTFSRMIQKMPVCTNTKILCMPPGSHNTLFLSHITPDILRVLLNYIYSGVLEDLTLGELIQLYEASHSFDVYGLTEVCIVNLKKKITKDDMVDLVNVADKFSLEFQVFIERLFTEL